MSANGLDYDSINENVKKAQYAVRGELYLRASELQMQGKKVCALYFSVVSIKFEVLCMSCVVSSILLPTSGMVHVWHLHVLT